MWVYPAVKNTPLPKVFEFAQTPQHSDSPNRADINTKQKTMGGAVGAKPFYVKPKNLKTHQAV